MTLTEMCNQFFTGYSHIRKNTNTDSIMLYGKAVRIGCIMRFEERDYIQRMNRNCFFIFKRTEQIFFDLHTPVRIRFFIDVNRNMMFLRDHFDTTDVINMLMRNKNCAYFFHR